MELEHVELVRCPISGKSPDLHQDNYLSLRSSIRCNLEGEIIKDLFMCIKLDGTIFYGMVLNYEVIQIYAGFIYFETKKYTFFFLRKPSN